jgi:type III restriction enzyme
LATQTVAHFKSYLSEDDTRKLLALYQDNIARFIHAQMQSHYWEEATGYEVVISQGFTELKPSAYTHLVHESPSDYQVSPPDKSNMAHYLFGGFKRCLYQIQKFASDAERRLAGILERDTLKWFKPALGQFQIYYRQESEQREYQPDFVAETDAAIYMLEPKASNQMNDPIVLAKQAAAATWCAWASEHNEKYGGKPWRYALIPHDVIAENMTIVGLVRQYGVRVDPRV